MSQVANIEQSLDFEARLLSVAYSGTLTPMCNVSIFPRPSPLRDGRQQDIPLLL